MGCHDKKSKKLLSKGCQKKFFCYSTLSYLDKTQKNSNIHPNVMRFNSGKTSCPHLKMVY